MTMATTTLATATTIMLRQVPLQASQKSTRCQFRLPAVMMRAGTSRGLFLHRSDMPKSVSDWPAVLLSAMGSKNGDMRQIDGLGGGSSTTSKVVVVSKSETVGIDLEYTFVQVAVGRAAIDMTGNCGNMSSGVAAFALDEGLVRAPKGVPELSVRVYNTNTKSTIVQTIQVDRDGRFDPDGDYSIPGIDGTGSPIRLTFEKPIGSMTGSLFPTGHKQEALVVSDLVLPNGEVLESFTVQATVIDSANPFVFVDSATLPDKVFQAPPNSDVVLCAIEAIRRVAAVRGGLAQTIDNAAMVQGTPKIALLSRPTQPVAFSGQPDVAADVNDNPRLPDVRVVAYSMGKVHPSLQLTGAVTLGTALSTPGTVAATLAQRSCVVGISSSQKTLPEKLDNAPKFGAETKHDWLIAQPGGLMDVQVKTTRYGEVLSATVFRTARRLFEGSVIVRI